MLCSKASSRAGAEALRLLRDYMVYHMHLDSFGVRVIDEVDDLFEVKETVSVHGTFYSVTFYPPVNFPRLPDESILQQTDCKSVESAKVRIATNVVEALTSVGRMEKELDIAVSDVSDLSWPTFPHTDPEVFQSDGGIHFRQMLLPSYDDRWLSGQVSMYIVAGCEDGLGFATTAPAKHNYQLKWGEENLRLEVVHGVQCLPATVESMKNFHCQCFSEETVHEQPEVLVVKVSGGSLDLESIRERAADACHGMPGWVRWLSRRLERLMFWELVCSHAPIQPSPCPIKMEKIFDCPDEIVRDDFDADFRCMVLCGRGCLQLAAAVAESVRDPEQSRASLERKVSEYFRADGLAELWRGSVFMGLGTRELVKDDVEGQMKDMLLALLGAQMLDSDLFGALQIWEWFLETDRKKVFRSLMPANSKTAGCPAYLGGMASYLELGEVDPDSDLQCADGQGGPARYLRVGYENYDDAYYRWNGFVAQECRPDVSSEWRPLVLDPLSGSLCSPSMKCVSNTGDWKPRPLPNKCSAWLRGKPLADLLGMKHTTEPTHRYLYLREEEHEYEVNGEKVISVCLYVFYEHQKIEVSYHRSLHGGLGTECFLGRHHHLIYSECRKVILSHVMTGSALPRRVVHWLLDGRCLADIIPPRTKNRSECDKEDGVAFYTAGCGDTVYVRAKVLTRTSGLGWARSAGALLQFSLDKSDWTSLSYSEQSKEWVRYANQPEEEAIRCEAICKVLRPFRDPSESVCFSNVPAAARGMFPNSTGTAVAELENNVHHKFGQQALLAQALTHCSSQTRLVKSNECLAYLGEAVMCAFATEKTIRESAVFGSRLHRREKDGEVCAESFSMPAGCPWPARRPDDQCHAYSSVTSLDRRVKVCCNHVTYAASCIKAELHLRMTYGSEACASVKELNDKTAEFAKRIPQQADECRKWARLFKLGAPKALGDAFLAVVGAITMDADVYEAHALMDEHYKYTEDLFRTMATGLPPHTVLRLDELESRHAVSVDFMDRLFLEAPKLSICSSLNPAGGSVEWELAKVCSDICVLHAHHNKKGYRLGMSPRSLLVHLALEEEEGGRGSDSDQTGGSNQYEEGEAELEAANKPMEHEGAVYCSHCDKWLNGPAQWADHEFGRKHRKKVRSMQSNKSVRHSRLSVLPDVPEAFGKTPWAPKSCEEGRRTCVAEQPRCEGNRSGQSVMGNVTHEQVGQRYKEEPEVVRYLDDQTGELRNGYVFPWQISSAGPWPHVLQ